MQQCISMKNDKGEIFVIVSTDHNLNIFQIEQKKMVTTIKQIK